MKLTLTNIKKMKTNSTPLQKRVINYIVDEWSNYDDTRRFDISTRYVEICGLNGRANSRIARFKMG